MADIDERHDDNSDRRQGSRWNSDTNDDRQVGNRWISGGGGGGGDRDNRWGNDDNNDNRDNRDKSHNQSHDDGVPSLHVTGLSFETTDESLREAFEKFGPVQNITIIKDPVTKVSRGYGFVTFVNVPDSDKAVEKMNGGEVDGRIIRAEKAKRRDPYPKTPGQYLGNPTMSAKYARDGFRGRDGGNRGNRGDYPPSRGGGGGYRDDYPPRYRDEYRGGYESREQPRPYGGYDRNDRGRYDDGPQYRDRYPPADRRPPPYMDERRAPRDDYRRDYR